MTLPSFPVAPNGKKLNLVELFAYCQERTQAGEAAMLIEPLLGVIEQLHAQLLGVENRLGRLLKDKYGSRSERVSSAQLQLALEKLSSVPDDIQLLPSPEPGPKRGPNKKQALRTPRQIPQSIPRRVIHSEPCETELICTCGKAKEYIGSNYVEVLDYQPGGFYAERTERRKYACRSCQSGVVVGPAPPRVLEQAMPGPGLLAEVVVRKYSESCPSISLHNGSSRRAWDAHPTPSLRDVLGETNVSSSYAFYERGSDLKSFLLECTGCILHRDLQAASAEARPKN